MAALGFASDGAERRAVLALDEKFAEMQALRGGHIRSAEVPARVRALSKRFPGALRELDDIGDDELRARRAELAAVRLGAPTPQWAVRVALYHGTLRAALRVREAIARGRAVEEVLADYVPASDEPSAEFMSGDARDALRGTQSVHRFVLTVIARELGLEVTELLSVLFPDRIGRASYRAALARGGDQNFLVKPRRK